MKSVLVLSALLGLGVCAAQVGTPMAAVPAVQSEAVAVAPLIAAGPPETIQADSDLSADVIRVDYLKHQGEGSTSVKLLGWGGGDPAVNGLQTHIAFFVSPGEGWRVFTVGDFLDYRVLADSPGRVDLEIDFTGLDEETHDFNTSTRRAILTWTASDDWSVPDTVTLTPAK